MDMDIVEKVAEAIWQQDSIRVVGTRRLVLWAEAGDGVQETARWQARAAIQAIKEAGWKSPDEIDELLDGVRENCAMAVKEGYDL